MPSRLITGPTVEPVTLTEIKAHLRVDDAYSDTLLTDYISAARAAVEAYLGRALLSQVWDYTQDQPEDKVRIPYPPLIGATPYVTDTDDTEAVVDSSYYQVMTSVEPGRLILKSDYTWPESRNYLSFRIRFTAGYGTTAASVPADIRKAIRMIVAEWFANREEGGLSEGVQTLLNPYRIFTVA